MTTLTALEDEIKKVNNEEGKEEKDKPYYLALCEKFLNTQTDNGKWVYVKPDGCLVWFAGTLEQAGWMPWSCNTENKQCENLISLYEYIDKELKEKTSSELNLINYFLHGNRDMTDSHEIKAKELFEEFKNIYIHKFIAHTYNEDYIKNIDKLYEFYELVYKSSSYEENFSPVFKYYLKKKKQKPEDIMYTPYLIINKSVITKFELDIINKTELPKIFTLENKNKINIFDGKNFKKFNYFEDEEEWDCNENQVEYENENSWEINLGPNFKLEKFHISITLRRVFKTPVPNYKEKKDILIKALKTVYTNCLKIGDHINIFNVIDLRNKIIKIFDNITLEEIENIESVIYGDKAKFKTAQDELKKFNELRLVYLKNKRIIVLETPKNELDTTKFYVEFNGENIKKYKNLLYKKEKMDDNFFEKISIGEQDEIVYLSEEGTLIDKKQETKIVYEEDDLGQFLKTLITTVNEHKKDLIPSFNGFLTKFINNNNTNMKDNVLFHMLYFKMKNTEYLKHKTYLPKMKFKHTQIKKESEDESEEESDDHKSYKFLIKWDENIMNEDEELDQMFTSYKTPVSDEFNAYVEILLKYINTDYILLSKILIKSLNNFINIDKINVNTLEHMLKYCDAIEKLTGKTRLGHVIEKELKELIENLKTQISKVKVDQSTLLEILIPNKTGNPSDYILQLGKNHAELEKIQHIFDFPWIKEIQHEINQKKILEDAKKILKEAQEAQEAQEAAAEAKKNAAKAVVEAATAEKEAAQAVEKAVEAEAAAQKKLAEVVAAEQGQTGKATTKEVKEAQEAVQAAADTRIKAQTLLEKKKIEAQKAAAAAAAAAEKKATTEAAAAAAAAAAEKKQEEAAAAAAAEKKQEEAAAGTNSAEAAGTNSAEATEEEVEAAAAAEQGQTGEGNFELALALGST